MLAGASAMKSGITTCGGELSIERTLLEDPGYRAGGGCVRWPMSERGEEAFTMISIVAVFAAFCIVALFWLA